MSIQQVSSPKNNNAGVKQLHPAAKKIGKSAKVTISENKSMNV
jgi:hypothetical protein